MRNRAIIFLPTMIILCYICKKYHGMPVTRVNSCKYLGLIIDDHLSWQNHVDFNTLSWLNLQASSKKLRNKLNTLLLKILYFSFVHSQLIYGIEVYANTTKSCLGKLVILNNKILRIIQNKPRRTHTAELYKTYTLLLPKLHFIIYFLWSTNSIIIAILYLLLFSDYFMINKDIHQHNTRSSNNLYLSRVCTTEFLHRVQWSVPLAGQNVLNLKLVSYGMICLKKNWN